MINPLSLLHFTYTHTHVHCFTNYTISLKLHNSITTGHRVPSPSRGAHRELEGTRHIEGGIQLEKKKHVHD
ncbi:hypothetical protein RSOLAG1IB_05866 [Rhizoctonia solani AG-1 IB]|uniref:Uncharacterized protein n=1 Tax=Thanatephorus cucumeris (strain AG1-IB / isolate 7/3/14) TaxID=1108050 RepID=A0A0B7F3N6_THACB|nr:hypothetical protein RSOLAG1IB_05866 [Rhizoctonia solani AG-1 IB]